MSTHLLILASLWLASDDPTPAEPPKVHVTIEVDFGLAGKPPLRREVAVPRGSNVVEATRAALPVEQDQVCCTKDDVWSIDGVGPDVRHHAYWFWRLDGTAGPNLPARYSIERDAVIAWSYGGRAMERKAKHRVVSLLPAATETMIAIGAEADLVAISHLCPQPEGRELPRVVHSTIDSDTLSMRAIDAAVRESSARRESSYRLEEETIRQLAPTRILTQGLCPVCAVPPEQAGALADASQPNCPELVELTPRTLADVAQCIRRVGDAVEMSREADIVARDFERRISAVGAVGAAKPSNHLRVAVVEWFDPLWISGEWIAEMVEVAGGVPVLAEKDGPSRAITFDALAAADPDVIVLAACSMDVARARREVPALTAHESWRTLRAVKAGRVYLMNGEAHFSSPGPGLARGVELLGGILADPDRAAPSSPTDWERVGAR